MAKRRCAYCGQREGHGHSMRCGVTRHGLDPGYTEDEAEVAAERDRYRQALEKIAAVGPNRRSLQIIAQHALNADQKEESEWSRPWPPRTEDE